MSAELEAGQLRRLVLPNGLVVVLLAAGSAPLATVAVLYRVGSRNEAVGHTGAAHLLEHMLFKGTQRNNDARGYRFMEAMWEIGANVNANTWLDRTMYYETLPIGYIRFALELEADRMTQALIADDARRAEMTVVRNELEQRTSSPRMAIDVALNALAYAEHPYHHPTIGWRTDVENMSTDRLRAFYRTFYRPDNATLFVAGGIDVDAVAGDVVEAFESVERPAEAIPEVHTSEPAQLGGRSSTIHWPGPTKMVAVGYHTPSALGERYVLSSEELRARACVPGALRQLCALEVLESILGSGTSSRLHRRLIDSGQAHSAGVRNGVHRDPALFTVVAAIQSDASVDAAMETIRSEIANVVDAGVSQAELLEAKSSVSAGIVHHEEAIENLTFALAEWDARGGWELHDAYREALRSVTLDDVSEVARAYLYDENCSVVRLEPGTPPVFTIPVAQAVAVQEMTEDVARPAIPAPVVSSVQPFAAGIRGGAIAEQLSWSFVRRDVAPTVHVRGVLQVAPTFSGQNCEIAQVTARMLSRGTASRDRAAIDARLREIGASRSYHVDGPGGDPLVFRFEATMLRESLGEMLELLTEELLSPKLSDEDLERERVQISGGIRVSQNDTTVRARQRLLEMLYPQGHPNAERRVEERLADLESIASDDVRAYHQELVSRGRLILSIVGDGDATNVERLLQRTFGRLSRRRHFEPDLQLRHNAAARGERSLVELERKPNADVFIGRATVLTRKSPEYQAALLANQILCGHSIEARLGRRLRAEKGLTYGAPGRLFGAALTPGFWNARISTNPGNVEMVVQNALEVLETFVREGPMEREIASAKSSRVGSTLVSLSDNEGIARTIESMEYFELGRKYVDDLREEIEAVPADEIYRVGSILCHPAEVSIVVAGSRPGE